MNYIKHLTGFFEQIINDFDLNPTHISLYIALFQQWNLNRFENPISITRDEVMRVSKIASFATYHKCMRELHNKGYIKYIPSYNPFKGSLVEMTDYTITQKPMKKGNKTRSKNNEDNEQALNKQYTSTHTSTKQALVSSINIINNTNRTNDINIVKQSKTKKNDPFKNQTAQKGKLGASEKNEIPPHWDRVFEYFISKSSTRLEAEKFYNHYSSNGWKVGGKTKMKDWHASARNWILNTNNYKPKNNIPQPNHLHTNQDKNYAEPL